MIVPRQRPAPTGALLLSPAGSRSWSCKSFVKQAVEALRSCEGWQRWLTTRRRFAYSFQNQAPAFVTAR